MTVSTPFQTLFAVPMTCDSCVKAVSDSLLNLSGITKVDANLKDQLVSVEGTAAPSAIVEAIQATGRDAILRGSGASNSAAVSILESFYQADTPAPVNTNAADESPAREVRGLARMVQTSPQTTLVDLTIRGVTPGEYSATIRESGDLSRGAASTGRVWSAGNNSAPKGLLGTFTVGSNGRGAAYINHPFQIWDIIGHAMVVSRQGSESGSNVKNDEDTVVGVVARSAGMWDNDKTVCSCTGKTLWEERKDEVKKGNL